MVGLVKVICTMAYGQAEPRPEDPFDVRVLFIVPELVESITGWYRENGWEVTEEPI
jgi:hypothetical protein